MLIVNLAALSATIFCGQLFKLSLHRNSEIVTPACFRFCQEVGKKLIMYFSVHVLVLTKVSSLA